MLKDSKIRVNTPGLNGYKSFTITKLQRDEKLEIPIVAIREVLLNMIVHRNYHIKAPSKIAIYDDRVEFFSPDKMYFI